jgi:hypothetical protein
MMKPAQIMLTLLLSAYVSFSQSAKELSITVSAPRGIVTTIDQSQTIFVCFNQPMVPLRELPIDESTGPLRVEPPLAGKYRWMGTATLAFIPTDTLPFATKFRITIPKGTRSASGATLRQEVAWEFETPRLQLARSYPPAGQILVDIKDTILLVFNQRVDPKTAAKYISIEENVNGKRTYPSFSVKPAYHTQMMHVEADRALMLILSKPMQMGAQYVVILKKGLKGIEGNLGTESDITTTFTSYGDFVCQGFINPNFISPTQPIRLRFSNPTTHSEVIKHMTIEPEVTMEIPDESYQYYTTEFWFYFPFKPEQQYKLTIKPGLKDKFGNELTGNREFYFQTTSYPSRAGIVEGPGILEATERHVIPVTVVNAESLTVKMGNIDVEKIVPLMLGMNHVNEYNFDQHVSAVTLQTPKATRNKMVVFPLDLSTGLGTASTGIVYVDLVNNYYYLSATHRRAIIQVTNLGLSVKFSPQSNLIWVTTLKDAAPVPGASVEIRDDANKIRWRGTTDNQGLVKTPGWGALNIGSSDDYSEPHQWVIVKNGDDIAFTGSNWNNGIEPWNYDIMYEWNARFEPIECMLFTDRGLYKANERIDFKGIMRIEKDGAWKVPENPVLRFVVRNSRGEEIYNTSPLLSSYGSFTESFKLSSAASMGYYYTVVEQQVKKKNKLMWEQVGSTSFRVESFKPAEFEVIVRPEHESYIVGDTASLYVNARYLFGAPMKNEAVNWRLSVTPTLWSPPGYENYFFGSLDWLSRYVEHGNFRMLSNQQNNLDNNGSLKVNYPLPVGEIHGTVLLQLEADVSSASRQMISGRSSAIIHAGEFYIGLLPSTTFTTIDSIFTCNVVAVTPEAIPLPNQRIKIQIIKRIWNSVRKAESGGGFTWVSEPIDSVYQQQELASSQEPVPCTFKPTEAGFYYIKAESQDHRGNKLLTHAYFYVAGSSYVAWERVNDDKIDLVADKKGYRPGDVANIIVKSPYESAPALVTIEREGVIIHFATTLIGSAPKITIPIEKDFLPNVFVSVVLLQGRKAEAAQTTKEDIGKPSFKLGYIKLSVSPVEKSLRVVVTPDKRDYRPGDTVVARIAVKNFAGQGVQSEVTMSVADLGVLNLIGYRFPDAFGSFYKERSLTVTTTETRIHIVEQRSYGEKAEDEGGGGSEEAMKAAPADANGVRKDFRPSAYWNGAIYTDDNGNADVRFRLPDNLTSFRAMAVAHTIDGNFGNGDTAFNVNKPLLLLPAIPRFVRVDDSFSAGVVAFNYTDKNKNVRIISRVEGVVKLSSDTTDHLLKSGESIEVRRTYRAEKSGSATFTFRALSGTESDGIQTTIPITVARMRESVALYESSTENVKEKAIIPKDTYRDLGSFELGISSTGMGELTAGLAYLFSYPYGCLEQRISRILPIILAEDVIKAFNLDVFKDQDYKAVVNSVLDEIITFQTGDGGFSYWKNSLTPTPYISSYAVLALIKAKQNGYNVDEARLKAGIVWIRQLVAQPNQFFITYAPDAKFMTQALTVYVLAEAEEADYGAMEQLYAQRNNLPVFAKAYLLRALRRSNHNASMIAELSRDLTNMVKINPSSAHFEERDLGGLQWVFHSNTRTTALALQSLIEAQPENPLVPKIVKWLLEQRRSGRWRTTQENMYVADALATYFRTYEKDTPNFSAQVLLAGGEALSETFKGRTLTGKSRRFSLVEMTPGNEYQIEFKKSGIGRLYYNMRLNYYPRSDVKAKEEGIAVFKSIESLEPKQKNSKVFKAGTFVRITINVVSTQQRSFVAVEDPLPAGFEPVNAAFQTTSGDVMRSANVTPQWGYNCFNRAEQFDDRVVLFADYLPAGVSSYSYLARVMSIGTFQLGATRAEGMYEPEVFGQTGSKLITVTP